MAELDWQKNGKRMARHPNDLKTVTVTISTTPAVMAFLAQLVATGLYGKNPAEAAERLVSRGLEHLVREGILDRHS